MFKALADPTRRAILDELQERDGQTLFELCARLTMQHGLGSTRQAVSQHLEVLEAAGLVDTPARGPLQVPRPRHHAAAARSPTGGPSTDRRRTAMSITVTSVLVDDQEKALRFYTDVLGFVKKNDIPLGEHRWLTVVSPEDPDGVELLLEPDGHPAVGPFKEALVEDGIPFTSFGGRRRPGGVRAADARSACGSPSRRRRWGRSRPPSSTTPAAT